MAEEWKLKVNAQYQEAMKVILQLATASLVLPFWLVRNFLNLKENQPLGPHLHYLSAYTSWFLLLLSIAFYVLFVYSSAKFVKAVCKGMQSDDEKKRFVRFARKLADKLGTKHDSVSLEDIFEWTRDTAIKGSIGSFFGGLICLLVFFLRMH
ncbi:MAG: hypothetical protein ACLQOO_08830 [Terriglobia bacterium]